MEECSLEHLCIVINVYKNLIADYCTLQSFHLILPILPDYCQNTEDEGDVDQAQVRSR